MVKIRLHRVTDLHSRSIDSVLALLHACSHRSARLLTTLEVQCNCQQASWMKIIPIVYHGQRANKLFISDIVPHAIYAG